MTIATQYHLFALLTDINDMKLKKIMKIENLELSLLKFADSMMIAHLVTIVSAAKQ